jgi:hypothetical protein
MEPTAPVLASFRSEAIRNHAAFIWSVADLLRGDYKQSEYGKVILPLTVIRRLDCVLEPTKQAVLDKYKLLVGRIENLEPVLQAVAGQQFYNTSPLTFTKLLDDPDSIADSLTLYIGGFSETARDVIDKFDFNIQIDRLRRANLLYKVIGKFAEIDLHPDAVSNIEMGYLYEELIRRFSELSSPRFRAALALRLTRCTRPHLGPCKCALNVASRFEEFALLNRRSWEQVALDLAQIEYLRHRQMAWFLCHAQPHESAGVGRSE